MFCKRMAAITKKARDKLEELREAHRAESERLLGVLGDVLADVREAFGPPSPTDGDDDDDDAADGLATDVADAAGEDVEPIGAVCERAGRMVLKTLTDAGGVVALSTAHETVSAHHGNNPMPLMERYYRSHRAALFALLEVLELEATSTDRRIIDAVEVLRANRHRIGEYLPEYHQGQLIDTSFAGEAWQVTLRDRSHPARLRRRQFEVCVFAHLADELRSGDVAVAGSESYANLHTQLMSWAECEPLVAGYCAQAGIAPTVGQAIAGWKAELTAAAAAVDAGYPGNADLVVASGNPSPRATQRVRSASENTDAALRGYAAALARAPLAPATQRTYASKIRGYLTWLVSADVDGDPLGEPQARDWAVRDYRNWLVTMAKRAPATVNNTLAAIDDFYTRAGLGPAAADRLDLPTQAPRALDDKAALRWLRAIAAHPGPRDRVLALLPFYAGLRIAETVALDLDDIALSARKGTLRVRGKGATVRELPIHPQLRADLALWLDERPNWPGADTSPALLLNRRGGRLSVRGASNIIQSIASNAGLSGGITAHVGRHTFATTLVRGGTDLVVVADLLGHARLDTVRAYTRPTEDDRTKALNLLPTDR